MQTRLLLVSALSAAVLLSACGGSDHSTPATPAVPVTPAPAAAISAATLAQIDTYVQSQMSRQEIPGLSVVVTMDGKPVLEKGYGMANLESKTPVATSTVFRLGSVSKQFAATGIMLLVQEGKMGLDDPLSKYLSTVPAGWSAITIRQLMQHTSGMRRDFPQELLAQIDPAKLPPIDTLVALASSQMPLQTKPGAAFAYSNVGYHLLGFVIEKVSGKYYADFLQERLFTPLGMQSAEVIRGSRAGAAMATGYTITYDKIVPSANDVLTPGLIEAEGGLQMSAPDLGKWDAALRAGTILSKASLEQMLTPARLNDGSTVPYGLGWSLDDANHHPFSRHNGQIAGFTSQFDRHTSEGLSVIVLANFDLASPAAISTRIAAIIKPELDWAIAATDPQPATTAQMRGLLEDVRNGSLKVDQRFTPRLQAAFTPEVVALYAGYFKRWPTVDSFGYIDQIKVDSLQVSRYLVRTQGEQAVIGIAYDDAGRIAFFSLMSE